MSSEKREVNKHGTFSHQWYKHGTFSHQWYDDMSKTLFIYFNNVHIQNLGSGPHGVDLKECCLHVDPESFQRMKESFAKAEKVEDLFL